MSMSDNSTPELFRAVKSGRWEDALYILHNKSEHYQAQYVDRGEWGYMKCNALHWACHYNDTPVEVVRLLLNAFVDAALVQDAKGETPLHIATQNNDAHTSSDEIVAMLVKACPQAASFKNRWGKTPLHCALQRDRSTNVIRALFRADPFRILVPDDEGTTPSQCFFRNWNYILRHNKASFDRIHPSFIPSLEINNIFGRRTMMKEVYDKTRLLLVASHGIIEELYPYRIFLLHLSIKAESFPWAFFHLLLRSHPEEAWIEDPDGNLPIHLAAKVSKSSSDGELYKCDRCKLELKTTPWYHGKYSDYCKNCFRTPFGSNFTLVHPVCKGAAIIDDLIALNPKSASIPSREGRLAIHLAIEHGKEYNENGVKKLFYAAPDAIRTRDSWTHMFPFMMAALEPNGWLKENGSGLDNGGITNEYMLKFTSTFRLLMKDPSLAAWGIQ